MAVTHISPAELSPENSNKMSTEQQRHLSAVHDLLPVEPGQGDTQPILGDVTPVTGEEQHVPKGLEVTVSRKSLGGLAVTGRRSSSLEGLDGQDDVVVHEVPGSNTKYLSRKHPQASVQPYTPEAHARQRSLRNR